MDQFPLPVAPLHTAGPRRVPRRAAAGRLAALALCALGAAARAAADEPPPAPIEALVAEALAHNPEIAAARHASDAAAQRITAAGALEDPMLEAGVVNAPLPFSLRRDDMTMQMLGLSQKLPYPGKRSLRAAVATADAASIGLAVEETTNRVVRDLRVAYEELRLAETSARIAEQTRAAVRRLVAVSESRLAVGAGSQSDVLQAQAQLARLQQEQLRLEQERAGRESELRRLLGRERPAAALRATPAVLLPLPAGAGEGAAASGAGRPQLRALAALVDKGERELELARREYYPDLELRLGYGRRERTLEGLPRDDMITMTVAVNLPIWRQSRLGPRVAEAHALRAQAAALADAERLATEAGLEQQLARAAQTRASAELYRTTLLPQTRAASESALGAYRVGRVDFLTLLDSELREHEALLAEATAIADHNKAIAEIALLTGTPADGVQP